MPNQRKSRGGSHLFFFVYIALVCLLDSTSARIVGGRRRISEENDAKAKEDDPSSVHVSTIIPSLRDTTELVHLSRLVYYFRRFDKPDCSSFPLLYEEYIQRNQPATLINANATYTCHMYERNEEDTQVLILSREYDQEGEYGYGHGYVAVIYAGTDDFRTALSDADLRTTPFGPEVNGTYPLAPSDDVRVHAGFNNEVFKHGLFDRVTDTVKEAKRLNPQYRIFTTGHSLGAANADLTAVAMKMQPEWEHELIVGINFGSPKTGNWAWTKYVNSIEGLGIWRVVNGFDLVPRLPDIRFHHVGHTVQLDRKNAKAYWLHDGDKALGYRGVPFGWSSMSYALAPAAAVQHMIGHYTNYFDEKSALDESTFYIESFEKTSGYDDDDTSIEPSDDDDNWYNNPDDDIRNEDIIINEYAENYLALVEEENDEEIGEFGFDGLLAPNDEYSKEM